jgi:hypothetical protein
VVLLSALGYRFAAVAYLNHRRTEIATQAPIWRLLTYVGVLAVRYGLLGVVRVLNGLPVQFDGTVMPAVTLVLAVGLLQAFVGPDRLLAAAEGVCALVFLVMVATALMTATIKLRQNPASLCGSTPARRRSGRRRRRPPAALRSPRSGRSRR